MGGGEPIGTSESPAENDIGGPKPWLMILEGVKRCPGHPYLSRPAWGFQKVQGPLPGGRQGPVGTRRHVSLWLNP